MTFNWNKFEADYRYQIKQAVKEAKDETTAKEAVDKLFSEWCRLEEVRVKSMQDNLNSGDEATRLRAEIGQIQEEKSKKEELLRLRRRLEEMKASDSELAELEAWGETVAGKIKVNGKKVGMGLVILLGEVALGAILGARKPIKRALDGLKGE